MTKFLHTMKHYSSESAVRSNKLTFLRIRTNYISKNLIRMPACIPVHNRTDRHNLAV